MFKQVAKNRKLSACLTLDANLLLPNQEIRSMGVGMMPAAVAEKIKLNYKASLAEFYASFTEVMISTSKHAFQESRDLHLLLCNQLTLPRWSAT